MDVRVIRVETGEVIQEYDNISVGQIISGTFVGTPAEGDATYEIQVRMNTSDTNGGAYCLNRALNAEVFKR